MNMRTTKAFTILWVFLFFLSACGDRSDDSSSASSDTGSIAFSVQWQDAPTGKSLAAAVQATSLDCETAGVHVVEARVYDEYGADLAGDQWPCYNLSGTIRGVLPGSNLDVVILGKDQDGNILYRGAVDEKITVTAGAVVDCGIIDAHGYVPDPLAPANVTSDAGTIQWDAVEGAEKYCVVVSESSDLSNPIVDDVVSDTSIDLQDLSASTVYYWKVHARDSYGNDGACSDEVWSFKTLNPTSYTKLDAQGNDLPDSATEWSMVRDNVTGLIWEVKTDDGTEHDKDNTYTWQDAQDVFIAQLNTDKFGGYSDWRLPAVTELSFIVNSGTDFPAINTAYFPNTMSSDYWSSTFDASYTVHAWRVGFVSGNVNSVSKSYSHYVRAVRGGHSEPADRYVDNGDGTVTDTSTGLMWQEETADARMWLEAITYCEALSLAGYTDWRLPNRNELQSIVDYTRWRPAIDTNAFPNTMSSDYWSSTTDVSSTGTDNAWRANFYYGDVSYGNKSDSYYVRAVRGGQ